MDMDRTWHRSKLQNSSTHTHKHKSLHADANVDRQAGREWPSERSDRSVINFNAKKPTDQCTFRRASLRPAARPALRVAIEVPTGITANPNG